MDKNNDYNILDVTFNSIDQGIVNYKMKCFAFETFAEVELKLYKNYPQYKENDNYFLVNGHLVKRFKTICENRIKTGDIIIIYIKS